MADVLSEGNVLNDDSLVLPTHDVPLPRRAIQCRIGALAIHVHR